MARRVCGRSVIGYEVPEEAPSRIRSERTVHLEFSMTTTLAVGAGPLPVRPRPSREQLRVAAAMFAAAPEDVTSVVVPIVLTEPDQPTRSEVGLEHPGGYWLADRSARAGSYSYNAARAAATATAQAHLHARGLRGVPGSVSIRPDGSWQCTAAG
jgi:hypothetical protein